MRIKKVENDSKEHQKAALEKKKKGDTQGALREMRKYKMKQGDLAKLEGQMVMLEQQEQLIHSVGFDNSTFSAMKAGKEAVTDL